MYKGRYGIRLACVLPVVYLVYGFHVTQGWLGNRQYIDPIYRKPSFARYNSSLCSDARSIEEEIERLARSDKQVTKYYQQGRGLTRDLLHTASLNDSAGSVEVNPSLAARTSNRGLYHP